LHPTSSQVRYHLREHTWIEIYRAYQSMWDTPSKGGAQDSTHTLKCMCIYLFLSPFDKDRTEQLHVLAAIKQLGALSLILTLTLALTRTRTLTLALTSCMSSPPSSSSARSTPPHTARTRTEREGQSAVAHLFSAARWSRHALSHRTPRPSFDVGVLTARHRTPRPPSCVRVLAADLPMYKELVRLFTTTEIFHFGELREALQAELVGEAFAFSPDEVELMLKTFHRRTPLPSEHRCPPNTAALRTPLPSEHRTIIGALLSQCGWSAVRSHCCAGVTEHNLGVVAAYYSRITMERLSALLELDIATMEEQLCEMVSNKQVSCLA
jgi:hypothetical protein